MNIWDSVHRGLEKASHEAARIAKAQKLRSQIDGLSRQLHTQETTLLTRTMELFAANQLTQSQLLPLCHEITSLQQQLEQAQNEIKLLQSQGPQQPAQIPPSQPNSTGTYQLTSPYSVGELPPTLYAPPPPSADYPPAIEPTTPMPPPPPGSEALTISEIETRLMGVTPTPPPPPAIPISIRCVGCQSEITSGLAYCPNCGRPTQESTIAHLPTMRGGALEPFYPAGQETVRGEAVTDSNTGQDRGGMQAEHIADQETRRSEFPPDARQPNIQDGGY